MKQSITIRKITYQPLCYINVDKVYYCIYDFDDYRVLYSCDYYLRIYGTHFWKTHHTIEDLISDIDKLNDALCKNIRKK